MRIKKIVYYGLVAGIYTCLSIFLNGISFGPHQIRVAEVLMVFCILDKEYIWPLTLGCFLTNIIGILMGLNIIVFDVIFGTLATFISGYLMNRFASIKLFNKPLISLIIPAFINAIAVGSEFAFYFNSGNFMSYFTIYALYVFIGEFISVFILGLMLLKPFSTLQAYIISLN